MAFGPKHLKPATRNDVAATGEATARDELLALIEAQLALFAYSAVRNALEPLIAESFAAMGISERQMPGANSESLVRLSSRMGAGNDRDEGTLLPSSCAFSERLVSARADIRAAGAEWQYLVAHSRSPVSRKRTSIRARRPGRSWAVSPFRFGERMVAKRTLAVFASPSRGTGGSLHAQRRLMLSAEATRRRCEKTFRSFRQFG